MEAIIIVLVVVGLVIGIPVLIFVRLSRLEKKILLLEKNLRHLKAAPVMPRAAAGPDTPPEQGAGALEPEAPEAPEQTEETGRPKDTARDRPAASTAWKTAPPPKASLEETVGAKWTIWLGGLALALGGIFLVRYSVEYGLLGPKVRLVLAALLALVLAGTGEVLRRRDAKIHLGALPPAYIPGILTAAGVLTGYASIYAAFALYGFLGPLAAFVLLALVSVAGLALSVLHGPSLAALGMAGSYVTPLLTGSDSPSIWPLYIYLLFVTAAAFFTASLRGWLWLAVSSAAGAVLWGFLWNTSNWSPGDVLPSALYFITLTALGLVFLKMDRAGGQDKSLTWRRQDWPVIGVLAGISLLAAALLRLDEYSDLSLGFFALITAVHLASAWRWRGLSALAAWAAALFGFAYLSWHVPVLLDLIREYDRFFGFAPPEPSALDRFLIAGAVFGLTFAATGFAAVWKRGGLEYWSAASTLTPLGALIYGYIQATRFEQSVPFALAGVALAAIFTLMAEVLGREASKDERRLWNSGIYTAAAFAALALALTMVLEKGWLTVAIALLCPAMAFVTLRRPVPVLRKLAAAMALIVVVRLIMYPLLTAEPGMVPVFNWLLYAYGVPALAFAASAVIFLRKRDDIYVQVFEVAAIAFTTALIGFQVRHLLNNGVVTSASFDLPEMSIHTLTWAGLSLGLNRLDNWRKRVVLSYGSLVLGLMGITGIVLVQLLALNPLMTNDSIGAGLIFNQLILAYLLPALLYGLIYVTGNNSRHPLYLAAAGAVALVLVFAYLSLEIRALFQGNGLLGLSQETSDGEMYTYSAIWLLYGLALLGAGIISRTRALRYASFAVVMLSVSKVFLFDMSNLTGIFRALSFIGLGMVLIGIGYVYQRAVFPAKKAAQSKEAGEI